MRVRFATRPWTNAERVWLASLIATSAHEAVVVGTYRTYGEHAAVTGDLHVELEYFEGDGRRRVVTMRPQAAVLLGPTGPEQALLGSMFLQTVAGFQRSNGH